MRFIRPDLQDNPDEIHFYFKDNKRLKFASQFHFKALEYSAGKIESAKGHVAEIGCGEGYFLPTLSYHFNDVVAIDSSEKMLNIAQKYFKYENVVYIKDDISLPESLKITQKQYHWVVCLETLEHIPDIEEALKNIIKMVLPRGKILLSVPVEIGVPLLIKEIGRYVSYGKGSGWIFSEFLSKLIRGNKNIKRYKYGSHMGFDYREVISMIQNTSSVNIQEISFFPVNTKYFGFRAYLVIQKE